MSNKVTNRKVDSAQKKSWWNIPLIGKNSLIQMIQGWFGENISLSQSSVPESTIEIYKDSISQLRNISAIAKTIDNAKFTTKEFMALLRINNLIKKDSGEYKGLQNSIDLLRVAFETKDCFAKIEATESRFHSYSQQEFYNYVFELLERNVEKDKFKELVQKQLISIIPKVKTEEGKIALQSYVNQLEILSEDQLGLKLLFLFKQYDLSNFALLINVAKIADTFHDKNLESLNDFLIVIQVNAEMFLKLGEIIQIPKEKNKPDTYAQILQYIALRNRHQNSFAQFQSLVKLLQDWKQFYDPIVTIQQQYPPDKYTQPSLFKQEVPGFNLYEKYKEHI